MRSQEDPGVVDNYALTLLNEALAARTPVLLVASLVGIAPAA